VSEPVEHLIVGPERHGVVRFGIHLHAALRAEGFATVQRRVHGPPVVPRGTFPPGRGVHLQFTDRLFGADAQQAVSTVHDIAVDVRRGGGRVTATLHDLPQPADRANHAIRASAYLRLASLLDGVVVSSEHERRLLHDIGVRDPATVIPLPIVTPVPWPSARASPTSVAVFGFVYPDKGHADVLEAMRGLPPDIRMLAIGEPSAGHDDLLDGLAEEARVQGRSFVLTGHVPDADLAPLLREVAVPVVNHRHVSASGSLNSWISAGRRPLVPATRYVREIAARNPGALWLYDDDRPGLSAAIRAALGDPAATWLPPGAVCSPTPREAAEGYRQLLTSVHR
jgi:glycosyltransferase involved in cell wall biosynthesis